MKKHCQLILTILTFILFFNYVSADSTTITKQWESDSEEDRPNDIELVYEWEKDLTFKYNISYGTSTFSTEETLTYIGPAGIMLFGRYDIYDVNDQPVNQSTFSSEAELIAYLRGLDTNGGYAKEIGGDGTKYYVQPRVAWYVTKIEDTPDKTVYEVDDLYDIYDWNDHSILIENGWNYPLAVHGIEETRITWHTNEQNSYGYVVEPNTKTYPDIYFLENGNYYSLSQKSCFPSMVPNGGVYTDVDNAESIISSLQLFVDISGVKVPLKYVEYTTSNYTDSSTDMTYLTYTFQIDQTYQWDFQDTSWQKNGNQWAKSVNLPDIGMVTIYEVVPDGYTGDTDEANKATLTTNGVTITNTKIANPTNETKETNNSHSPQTGISDYLEIYCIILLLSLLSSLKVMKHLNKTRG